MENNNVNEATIPNGTEISQAESETNSTPTETEAGGASEEKPFLVRFKHKDMELSAEDAKNYAQKGMKYDELAPMLDDLNYLATIKERKPHELLKELINLEENNYKEDIIERVGEDEEAVELLMEKYRAQNKSKFEAAKEGLKKAEEDAELREVEALEGRIATEFGELSEAFPEIQRIEDVPKTVLKEAENGKNLFDAFLRYKYAEGKNIEKARQTALNNAKASAGNMSAPSGEDAVLDAFLKGLRS